MLPFRLAPDSYFLLSRAIFRLTGPDAASYLNGQMSQDIRLATDSVAIYGTINNFKGKMDGDAYIHRVGDALFIDTALPLRDSLLARLDRYIIADDAEIEDVTDSYQLIHILQPTTPPAQGFQCNRFGQDGYDLLLPAGDAPASIGALASPEDMEKIRISHRIPAWGHELDHDTMPPEAGLESRAISYSKGCYTGQEVISRIRAAGKTNRHLVLLQLDSPAPPATPLLCEGASLEKPAGYLTSTCCIDGLHIALAFRFRKYQEQTLFRAGEATAHILSPHPAHP